jgi:hypothetical protein
MAMMTDGLKSFAGAGLKRALERWTSTPARGLLTGALLHRRGPAVLTTGFVNAGILGLRQALERFEQRYQEAKSRLLASAVAQRLTVDVADTLLDDLSGTRRLVERLV